MSKSIISIKIKLVTYLSISEINKEKPDCFIHEFYQIVKENQYHFFKTLPKNGK